MPKPNEVQSNVAANYTVEEIPVIVSKLRATFNTDKTRSRAWRVSQLNALNTLLTEGRDELARALYEDMHCSPFEGKILLYLHSVCFLSSKMQRTHAHT